MIEQNLGIVKIADRTMALDSQGRNGGTALIEGRQEPVAYSPNSYTGQFSAPLPAL